MKKFSSVILALVLLISVLLLGTLGITASAAEYTEGYYTYTVSNGEATITDVDTAISGDVTIPSYLGGYPVIGIGKDAFFKCGGLTGITIPEGVTSIGDYAFFYCGGIASITIPDSVTSIGVCAFYRCSSLTSITMPNGVTSIGENTFYLCDSLTSITIPDSVTSIGKNAFYACKSLTSINIPDGVTTIGDYAFESCRGLTSIYMPNRITSIGDSTFRDCSSLTSITILDNVTSIGDYAFYNCCSLKNIIIPKSVTSVGDCAFEGCTNLETAVYKGSKDQWNKISIGTNNGALTSAELLCYCSTGHSIIAATCTTPKVCKVCGYVVAEALGHNWNMNGDHKTCTTCGFVEGDTLPEYTITYHLDDGVNALKNPDSYTEEDIINLKDATKVGYDFAGWFLDSNKKEQISVISGMGNVDVYAKFIPRSFSASFKDGVTVTLKAAGYEDYIIYLKYGETVDPYSSEIMSKYLTEVQNSTFSSDPNFSGWFYDANYTDIVSGDINLTTDTTLYCHFNNTSSDPATDMFNGSNSITYYNSDVTNTYRVPTLSDGKLTIEFKIYCYKDNTYYAASFNIENLTTNERIYSNYWAAVSGTPYRSATITATVNPGDVIRCYNGSQGYNWDSTYATVTFTTERVSSVITSSKISTKTIYYDESIVTPTPLKREGYTFIGWYDSNGSKITDTCKYKIDKEFTPKWQLAKYDISYNLNGGTNSPANPSSYTIEDSIVLSEPTKPGYTFNGWYSDPNFKKKVTSIFERTGDITLYAKFTVNNYTLTLDANGGTFAPKVTFVSDGVTIKSCYLHSQDTITAYRPNSKDGYIFAGWYTNNTLTSLFNFNTTIVNDTTLYARWIKCNNNIINIEATEKIDLTVRGKTEQLYAFVPLADGKITVTSESNNLDLYGTLYDATKNVLIATDDISGTDLDFTYTYSVKAGQLYYIAVKGNTVSTSGEAVVNISWTGACKITGTTYQNRQITVEYDTNYTLPQKPIREGYVFLGWFDEKDTQIIDGTWNFTTNKTLTAKWEEATYHTVIFKDINGNIISNKTYYLSEDIVAPELPTKAPDETYIYHARWDNNYTGVCTGDAVYSPVFDTEYIEYTIIFVDEDGTVLSRATYHWGDVVTPPTAPTKIADNTYTYTFAGWDKEVVKCAGNTTYTATYTPKYIDYTVVFKNWDGTVLSTKTYHYGDTIVVPANPTRPSDNAYNYAFNGWDKTVVNCEGDAIYTATFKTNYNDYTIVFKDWDGTVLSSKTYHYGDVVVVPSNPIRKADNTYTYTFNGWDKEVVNCTGDATYTATYKSNYIDYTVVFKDWDGLVLSINTYHYGDKVTIPNNPTRFADNTYTYTFNGWDNIVINCTGDTTYTATYKATYIDYTVVFKNWDGTVLSTRTYHYGDAITPPNDPTRPSDDIYSYNFIGWDSGLICNGNMIITAQYSSPFNEYTVIFKNWDGTILSTKVYHYGDKVTIPSTPIKDADSTYTYTFTGWDKEVVNCLGNATYTATYKSNYIDYTIVFKNWDGTVLSTKTYHYGDVVVVPSNPIRKGDNTYIYTFNGWDKEVVNCLGNATYTATYKSNYIDYTVVFKNWDGTVLSTKTYHYGDKVTTPSTPVKDADNTYTYIFNGWDKEVVNCVGNAIYTATYTPKYIDYTVVFKNWDGLVLSINTYHYGDKVTIPNNPTRFADNTYTYTFNGWDKEVVNCVGNAIYTATYTPKYINYTVVFKNWDGTVLSTETYHYGDKVTTPSTPVRDADNTYTYTFNGWDKEVVNCVGNATYTATYESNYIEYTVVFKDWNGTILSTKTYHYGDMIVVPDNPVRKADTDYEYTFSNWGKEISTCTGNAVYTAVYSYKQHIYEWVIDKPNNCGVDGAKHEECTVCHAKRNENTVIPATGSHKYSNNCDASCNVCGATRTAPHSYKSAVTKATTSKNGKIVKTCSGCKKKVTSTIYYAKSFSLSKTSFTYNGKVQTPTVTVKDAKGKVIDPKYYTLSYSSGRKNVGTYKIKVTLKGIYSGSKTLSYKINPISISKCQVSISGTSYTYNGKVIKPSVKVLSAGGSTLKNGTHYTVTYSKGCKAPGTYKVTVKMKGTYSGSKTFTYKINPISISKCKVSISGTSYYYNGKVIKPSVKVQTASGSTLKNGTHYTVSYSSGCKNPGTYKVVVKMKGTYSGSKTFTYTIKPQIKISTCQVSLSSTAYTYNGKTQTPSVKVVNAEGTTLKNGTHYTVTYSSGRKAPGTYKVTVKMKGAYTGSKTLTYKINPISISKCKVSISGTSYYYDGKTKTPSVKVLSAGGSTLKNGTHYTVSYSSGRKNVGTYKVTVKMKGTYSGSKTFTFKIIPPKTSISKITADINTMKVYITKKSTQVTGYEIQYASTFDFTDALTKTITSYKTTSATLSELDQQTTYYVRVRTYKTVSGVKYYSGWSTIKSIKTTGFLPDDNAG